MLGLLLALGAGGGFGMSLTMASNPAEGGTAAPVAAQSPSLPVDPAPDLVDDPATAPLATALPLVDRAVGRGTGIVHLSVPRGWVRSDLGRGRVDVAPAGPAQVRLRPARRAGAGRP